METSWSSQDIKSATQGEIIWKANEVHAQIQHLTSKLNQRGKEYNEKNLFNCLCFDPRNLGKQQEETPIDGNKFYITNITKIWRATGMLKALINRKNKRGRMETGCLNTALPHHAIIPFRMISNTGLQLLNT